jgi:hypothetical protein
MPASVHQCQWRRQGRNSPLDRSQIGALIARGFEVSATDMEPGVVGQELGGVKVRSNAANSELIKEADLAIITGMTLPNRTLPSIMEMAREHNTSTMIWAITGRNFGHYYLEQGVDCVISDPSPFLLLPGPARIGIWRREHRSDPSDSARPGGTCDFMIGGGDGK